MATLKAMFKLFDGYSKTIDKINRNTDKATDKITKASGATDKFNKKLDAIGASASKASSAIGKLVGAVISLAAIKKGIVIVDEYTNIASRLALISDDLQTQAELQNKIFAAANRSRGAYSDMADAIAKMGLMARDAFSVDGKLNTDELIAFTELVQKSFKIAGADTSMQQAAMRQLAQAMASGRLQGDELVSIMENAPMIYEAIAKYMGKTKGELKKLSSEGAITADIIKNAMFAAADDINKKFGRMPITFGDVWNRIKNDASRALRPVMEQVSRLINSKGFQAIVENITRGLIIIGNLGAKIFEIIVSIAEFIQNNWSIIEPIIWGIIGALLVYAGILAALLIKKIAHAIISGIETAAILALILAQDGLNAAMAACPITWIIAGIAILITLFLIFTEEIMGAIFWLGALFMNLGLWIANLGIAAWEVIKNIGKWFANLGLGIWEVMKATAGNIKSAFKNAWINIQLGFYGFVKTIVEGVRTIIEWLNKIPGVNISTAGLTSAINSYASKMAQLEASKHEYEDIGAAWERGFNTYKYGSVSEAFNTFDVFQEGWGTSAYEAGTEVGANIKKWLKDNLSFEALFEKLTGTSPTELDETLDDLDWEKILENLDGLTKGLGKEPVTVKGTGTGGAVKVDMSDEDLKYLRDIAEREYINKFSTATLAPNISIKFGDVKETADADKVAKRIRKILQEEIAMAAEGAY